MSDASPARADLGPLGAGTLHLAIDMQRLFAEATPWYTPALGGIVGSVERLCAAHPDDTVFARFVPPYNAAAAEGRWRHYYGRWAGVTGEALDPALLDLVAPLAALARPGNAVDKSTYSAFDSPALQDILLAKRIDTIVLTGVETDACVLATLWDAVDRGYRVIVPADAVASGSPAAHRAVLTHVLPRLSEQVDVTTTDALMALWA